MLFKSPKFKINAILPSSQKAPAVPAPIPAREHAVRPVAPSPRRVAYVVMHGMGQQVPYETISRVAELMALPNASQQDPFKPVDNVSVDFIKLTEKDEDTPLARAQFVVTPSAPGTAPTEVHVYEAYWAPLTEGQISFLETISFLFSAGIRGLVSTLRRAAFRRWMFGGFQELPIKLGTFTALLLALVAVCVLLLPIVWFTGQWQGLSSADSWMSALRGHSLLFFSSLASAGLYAWGIRYFLVQYVGDVAIYVSSHKVSKFEETRKEIKDRALSVLRQVYSARDGGTHGPDLYEKVVLIGHSLGSVIAYDALNAAIAWDVTECGGRMGVVRRTHRLITFGSPLDKIAFLFRTQVGASMYLREALAARRQPLILSYQQYRPKDFSWVNIYSVADIISGQLNYYDLPHDDSAAPPDPHFNPVQNLPDYAAWIPLVAHVQYWNNKLLRVQLLAALD